MSSMRVSAVVSVAATPMATTTADYPSDKVPLPSATTSQ